MTRKQRLTLKTISYGTVHVAVATTVAYLLTGNFTAALGIGLIEPAIQTGVFALHEMVWEGRTNAANAASHSCLLPSKA
ncbi:MAG: DUF2061 domain-containing protein [Hyphomicrobiales bacterium]